MTPLHIAAQNNQLKAMELLLIKNAQAMKQILVKHENALEIKNADGDTPLHIAARCYNMALILILKIKKS